MRPNGFELPALADASQAREAPGLRHHNHLRATKAPDQSLIRPATQVASSEHSSKR